MFEPDFPPLPEYPRRKRNSDENDPMAYLLEEHRQDALTSNNRHTYLGNGDIFVDRALAIRFATRDEAETKRKKLPTPENWKIVED
jgi:hypothetical protein